MATIDYPRGLTLFIEKGKSRSIPTSFRSNDPMAGPPFFEGFTDDKPAIFTGNFVFGTNEKERFWAWFRSDKYLRNGIEWFNMDIKNEAGLCSHECHFMGEPQLVSIANQVYTYSTSILARRLNDDLIVDNDEYYVESTKEQLDFVGLIDEGINIFAPEA
jgi:hypothetical protein